MEQWMSTKYDGYEVSNLGRVRNLYLFRRTKSGKPYNTYHPHILKPSDNGHGYKYISIHKDGEFVARAYIHRLVAEAFLENPVGYEQINHKDEDKSNNAVENLEWCNSQYNVDYSHSKEVKQINPATDKVVKIFKSARCAARETGFNSSAIILCCNGKQKTHKGYRWQYTGKGGMRSENTYSFNRL